MTGDSENEQESTTDDTREVASVDTESKTGADGSGNWGSS